MPRPPKDEVATTSTVTIRLTPDDRQRIERQIRARTAELPERSISALLRRLIREGEEGILLRLADDDRATLDRLVSHRTGELARLGVHEAQVTATSVVVGLIRDAGRAHGLVPLAASSPPVATPVMTAPPVAPTRKPAKTGAPPTPAAALDPDSVLQALLAAIEGGTSQTVIAREARIDAGQLSRFKREGSGLAPEKLARLAGVVRSKT